jgi:hypothetical protein
MSNNITPTMIIPRLTREYIRDGFKTLDYYTLYEPELALNFHYPDAVLFSLLAHVKKPQDVLDLGSYFGMFPFVIEEIYRVANNDARFKWTLVDNCLYTKELAGAIKNNTGLSNRWLNQSHLDGWHVDNVPEWKRRCFFSKEGDYYLPPSNPAEFYGFWHRISAFYNIQKPTVSMLESVEELQNRKFDLLHFDLTAGAYELNKSMFETIVKNNLNNDSIIVFDDMTPRHPNMLLLFQYILASSDFRPIAFSTGKIAMMRKQYKPDFIYKVGQAGLMEINHTRDSYYSFQQNPGRDSDWGDYLDIRGN